MKRVDYFKLHAPMTKTMIKSFIHVAYPPLVSHVHVVSLLQSFVCNAKIFNDQPVDQSENG